MRRKAPVPFGKGPTEKDPNHGHLAGGLLHSTGGDWHGATYATGQSSTLPSVFR
jgi:hypothetical protein